MCVEVIRTHIHIANGFAAGRLLEYDGKAGEVVVSNALRPLFGAEFAAKVTTDRLRSIGCKPPVTSLRGCLTAARVLWCFVGLEGVCNAWFLASH